MNPEALKHISETLFAMQEVLKLDALSRGPNAKPDANRVFGPVVAAHFSETRKALKLANSWATKEQHQEAVLAAAGLTGLPIDATGGMSPNMEFDLPGANICPNCGMGGRTAEGICAVCEM